MIASLGMYDMPALQPVNDRLWQEIRARLDNGPADLTRDRTLWDIWVSPDLLFAQTCGMPFRTKLHDHVALIRTPDYGLPGCPPGHYNSVIVVRGDDPATDLADLDGAALAYNEPLSQSGWAAIYTQMSARGYRPGRCMATGSHAASARAVADGNARFAALDALTWTLLQDHDLALTGSLRVLMRTDPTPALPFITRKGRDTETLARALEAAIAALPASDKAALHLKGTVEIPASAYLSVPTPPAP
ncbi:phosphate/phosphite/phosphonate ABC transporter substrate-binding protein [Thalassococcus sp. S3]|uniref:phosphate/phosphite/phosphonate ABC transporter substrate-binding protein n=1 Tax=Thalassococcus sp. S3 TaxID=2017482 RepID=UPI001023FDA7|nr:PhnD/SsuA/transferrin family substrate-binding protein [Thalassococcus sp. S3]QBF32767.1 hypothetical protein CFI11_16315 [Thalassococcus sp. S3]